MIFDAVYKSVLHNVRHAYWTVDGSMVSPSTALCHTQWVQILSEEAFSLPYVFRLWRFQGRDKKLDRFLPKNLYSKKEIRGFCELMLQRVVKIWAPF